MTAVTGMPSLTTEYPQLPVLRPIVPAIAPPRALFIGEPAAAERTLLDVLTDTARRHPTAPALDDETTVLVSARLNGRGLGSFLYSCEAQEKDISIAVETSEGVLELRGWDLELVRNTIDGSLPQPESKPIFEKETHAFLNAVRTGNPRLILADFRDAFQTQIAMDTAVRMMRYQAQHAVPV